MQESVTVSTHSISGLLVILLPSRQITQGAVLAEASRTARAASAPIRQDYREYKERKLQSILSINRWKLRAKGRNNSQHCWDLKSIVGRIQPRRLYKPCVMSVRGLNNAGRAVQTDPINIVALRFDDHKTKAMLRVVASKVCPFSNFA